MKESDKARLEYINDVFMLASLVQFKYIQTVGTPNEHNFKVEAHGLSIGKSAYLLDVAVTTLARFIRDNRIVWRGKKRFGYNPFSNNALIVQSGIPSSTIYKRMARGLTLHEALEHKKGDRL